MREAQGAPRGTGLKDAQGVDGADGADATAHVIRAFLIADIRGYTTFTEDHGDEAAAALATAFAERVASATNAAGGTLVELRGDEALAVFASPRQAIQAAVAIQDRLLEEAIAGTGPPLPVGIGLDVGEAVPVGDGYRGGALNLAARLCAEAAAGEILASQGFTHLARVVEGVDYRDRGTIQLKGIADPVHVVAVSARGADVAEHMRAFSPSASSDGRRSSRGKLQFRLLGPLEVDDGSGPIPLGGPKQRAVLAHLIVRANALVPAETLIDLVWGDEPPETARSIIHTYVSLLRRALGAERIQGQAPGYRLRVDGNELDTVRFDALVSKARRQLPVDPDLAVLTLEDALALWRGPALADLADQRGLFAEAARLDEQRLEAQHARLEGFLATDRPSRAVAELDSLVAEHPLDESLWGMLMLALYRDGRQGDALKAFHRARTVIVEELGVDPSPELERLQHRILEHDPGLELRGEPLRGYRLLEKLDDGRSGVLYRAIQPKVGRDVAVRVFHEQVADDPIFVRRFEPQAQRVAALEHPHIAPVYDYWREPGRAYLVTRFLKGGSLRGLLERGSTLDADHAARVVVEIAGALAFAHRQAVVHGDVGPSAIRFDGEGHAYLVDFVLGVDDVADRGGDVRRLAALARRLLPANEGLAELARQSEASTSEIDAEDLVVLVLGASGPVASAAAPADARNPYKGLRPFSEADAGDFFGRTELLGRLLARLSERGPGSRFLAVVGPSGAGKSSVVRAGLVPAIRAGALGDAGSTYVAEMLPGPRPFDELADALGRIALHADPRLREVLESGSRGLLTAVDRLVPPGAQLTIVIDQFEEVFTLARDEADRERFLESLRVAALDPDGRLRVVVTLRADFFDRPLVYPRFGELLAARTEAVPPLTPDELEQAIRRPAETVGLAVEPGLVAEMIADTAHQPGALPLLQYALTELFERRDGARLTLTAYQQVGGIAGALTVRADRIHDGLAPDRRHAARQVFLRLVTLGEGRPDTRRRVPRSELDALDVEREANDEVLDAFGRHRLLTFDREPATREPTVEIAHEALLTAWGRLRGWIDATREDLRHERRLALAGAEWRAADRDPSFLIRGARLEQVAVWADTTDLAIGRPERAYLKASLDEREREQSDQDARVRREEQLERRSRFRLRALAAVLAVATIVATSLTLFAVGQEQKATHEAGVARVRELAAAALAEREVDPERAILLAIEAVEEARLVAQPDVVLREATEALHLAIAASRVDQTMVGTGGPVAWGGDGLMATLAVGTPGSVDLRDATSGAIVRTIVAHQGEVTDLALSPDGHWLATAGADGVLRVWDPSTGEPGAVVEGEGPVSDLDFGAEGARVAAAWPDELVVRLVETSSGRELWRHEGPLVETSADGDGAAASPLADDDLSVPEIVGLSPDGRRVAVGAGDLWVFDTETGQTAFDPLLVPYGAGTVAWSPDGRVIATAGLGGAHTWDAATGELLDAEIGHASGFSVLAWSPDSRRLATGSHDVIVWDQEDGRLTESLTLAAEATVREVASLAFSPTGTRLAAGTADGSAVKVWDLTPAGAAEIAVLPSTGEFGDVGFSQDDRQVVSADDDGFVRLHDLETGGVSAAIGPRVAEHDLDVSPDGRWLVFGPAVWDLTTGSERFRFAKPPPPNDGTGWSPDSRLLAVVSEVEDDPAVKVLDLDGAVQAVLPERDGYETSGASFSPDGIRLVTIGSRWRDGQPETGRITVWDWRQGTVIKDIETPPAQFVTVDPTGRLAATGFGPVAIWDLIDGTHREIEGVESVAEVAFSPDGSLLAVPWAATVRLYGTATGQLRLVLGAGRGPKARVAFSGDGSMLAAHGNDEAYVWALDLDRLIAVARQELTRDWTDEECRRYLHQERCSP